MAMPPLEDLKSYIRDVPDFPKTGILYRDITPLLNNAEAFTAAIRELANRYHDSEIDVIVAAEARGFLFGVPLAMELGVSFVPIRKPGKLPYQTRAVQYELEYGTDCLEMHVDGIEAAQRVLIVDDLLATGGTVAACCQLVEGGGGIVVECAFLIDLTYLGGAERLAPHGVFSLIQY
jgi:adenine phosphoribosyltransferase